MTLAQPFSPDVLLEAERWAQLLSVEWASSFPPHGRDEPGWLTDIRSWVDGVRGGQRRRTAQAMKRLYKTSPREYEVAYRLIVLGESFGEVTLWLNERAERNGIPLPEGRDIWYTQKDTVALFIAALEFHRAYSY